MDQSRVDYSWDDAERLREIINKNAQGVNSTRSTFVYDGFSRKAIAREYTWNSTNSTWSQTSEVRYVHDGMEVVQERDASNVIQTKYVRDGNIGGLLSKSTSTETFFYHYDGSGNVVQMSDGAKVVVAEYRYDAFGNTLSATGTQAGSNRYRFSTKELHTQSGLYDYGYRFYSPGLGRWINRDPIEESGGLNLYGFVGNDPIDNFDDYGEQIRRHMGPKAFTADGGGGGGGGFGGGRSGGYGGGGGGGYGGGRGGGGGRPTWTKPGHTRPRGPRPSKAPKPKPSKPAPSIRERMRNCRGPNNPGLPHEGRFRYVPPKNYDPRNPLPRGPQNGFRDRHGNEWTWDNLHNNHWDVQVPGGGHMQGKRMRNEVVNEFLGNWVNANFRDLRGCSRPTHTGSCV